MLRLMHYDTNASRHFPSNIESYEPMFGPAFVQPLTSLEQMRSSQPGLNDVDRNDLDNPGAVPEFARAWKSAPEVSSVRRPVILPDPKSYHEAVEPQAIFELDEVQDNGAIETILVVPFSCHRCRSQKQACSRARPACLRCRNANSSCVALRGGYQRLPRPKVGKSSMKGKQHRSGTCDNSESEASSTPEPSTRRTRATRIASGSKRPLSPESDYVPLRKKIQARSFSRKGRTRCDTVSSDEEMDIEYSEVSMGPSAQVASTTAEPTDERSALKWTFVYDSRVEDKESSLDQDRAQSVSINAPTPRVWTNVRLTQIMVCVPEADVVYSRWTGS